MLNRIKNWIKFNESQLDMFSSGPWEKPVFKEKGIYVLDREDLEEYFIDFIDEGWYVNFFFAFYNEEYDYEYLVKERDVLPLIRINIYGTNRSKGGDYLTKSLLSTINRLGPRFSKVKVLDESGTINPEDLKFEDNGDIFIKSETDNIEDEMQIEGDLLIDLVWFKKIYLTDKMIFNYYELEKNFEPEDLEYKNNEVIVGFPVSEIRDWVLDRKSSHLLVVGVPDFLDWSYYDDYDVDDNSFFTYHLESETKKLLIEKLIGDKFEELQEEYDFLNDFNTLEDLIQATISPGYKYKNLFRDLGKMLSEEEVYQELKEMYSDYYNQQKNEDDYDAIMKSFYQIVEDVLHTPIMEEYQKDDKLWYKIKFNFEWLEYEEDVEYIRKEGLNYMISNWCYKNYDLRELKPYFSDYASIDEKAFNQECREILNTIQIKPQLESKEPKVGTGKKPKGSSRRLYTDENPDDTVSVKFRTLEDVRKTVNSDSFKSKSHKRQSQIINLIEQRLRVAVSRAKDDETKKRLKRAHDYIKGKCEASKEKTKRLKD